ncbi:MAG TPA: MATE family efflux transporter [Thermoanaerobaculia bacterium]|nr:MATE family efflux transporter [Thermoanaerobaculia bacterium]
MSESLGVSTGEVSAAAPTVDQGHPGFWKTVGQALRGVRHDYTDGPIGRAIILLAVPMVLEMVLESVFAVVDVFWVSRLGADAVATVGMTESMLALIYSLAIGLSMGAAATVARRIGEKDPDGAARAAVQSIALGIAAAIPIGIVGALFAPQFLALMGGSPAVIANSSFTRLMLGANVVILLLFLINAIFRGSGDPSVAMRILWAANAINLLLDPCFIFGLGPFPKLGVLGAAVSTTCGRGIGVLLQFWILSRGRGRVAIRREHIALDPAAMWRLVRISANGVLQALIGTASWIGIVRLLTTFGSAIVAGYTIGIRIIVFAILPSWGLSNAAATMVGQNLGAKKPDRAEKSVYVAAGYNMIFLGGVGVAFAVFAKELIRLFTSDPAVLPVGTECLRIISYGFLFYAVGMVMTQAFNGAGDTWTPTRINFFIFWIFEIPLAWFLSRRTGMGPQGVFAAIAIAFSSLAVVSLLVFRRGKWKEKKV